MPGPPRLHGDAGPPAGLVVAGNLARVERVGHVLTGQVLASDHPDAGLLIDLPYERLLDGFAWLDAAAGKRPMLVIPGHHDHPAVRGDTDTQRLSDLPRRWHPARRHQREPGRPRHLPHRLRRHRRIDRAARYRHRRTTDRNVGGKVVHDEHCAWGHATPVSHGLVVEAELEDAQLSLALAEAEQAREWVAE